MRGKHNTFSIFIGMVTSVTVSSHITHTCHTINVISKKKIYDEKFPSKKHISKEIYLHKTICTVVCVCVFYIAE